MPTEATVFLRLGTAVLLGLFIGLQREYHKKTTFGGSRTFALISLAGATAVLVSEAFDQSLAWTAISVVFGAMVVAGYWAKVRDGRIGATTEIAALVTYLCGSLVYLGQMSASVAIAVTTAILLSIKMETQRLASALDREDIIATAKFAAITALVLPVLPNQNMGPEPINVMNPYGTWLMVVLISGISFLGYVLVKLIGAERGIGVTGLVGGLISSTAVTLSFSERSRETQGLERALALAVIISWTTMYARVMLEVAVLNRTLLLLMAVPLGGMIAVGLGHAAWLYFRGHSDTQVETPKMENPFGLGPAISFGALYLVIKVAAHLGQLWLGDAGIYASSIFSGIADVDAITLSMAELSQEGGTVSLSTAGRAIILATLSNTLVKGGMVAFIGSKPMRWAIAPSVAMLVIAGAAAIWAL